MKRILLTIAIILLTLSTARGDTGKMSVATQVFLSQLQNSQADAPASPCRAQMRNVQGVNMVPMFIDVSHLSTNELQAAGVSVTATFGDHLITALVPVSKIEEISNLDMVRQIAIGTPQTEDTDSMRSQTNANDLPIAQSLGYPDNYTGKGVVIGIIDSGIDYNHLAFKDAEGHTRIKRVYMPFDKTGVSPVVNNNKLPGSEFDSTQVYQLTSDMNGVHGTHCLGIAAGSEVGEFRGLAPEADIVACGLGGHTKQVKNKDGTYTTVMDNAYTDVDIANCAKYIVNYAKSVGKRCVITRSGGSRNGPRNGTSRLCRVFDLLAANDSAIICLSVGNNGYDQKRHFKQTFTDIGGDKPQFALHFTPYSVVNGVKYVSNAKLDTWGTRKWKQVTDPLTHKPKLVPAIHAIQIFVYDADKDSVVYRLPKTEKYQYTSFGDTHRTGYNSTLSQYFNGTFGVWNEHYLDTLSSGLHEVFIEISARPADLSKNYQVGIAFYGDEGLEVEGWLVNPDTCCIEMRDSLEEYSFIEGDEGSNMNIEVTGKNTISAGAYVSKEQVTNISGKVTNDGTLGSHLSYSSYGTDMNGTAHPFISAPGSMVVSSFNTYSPFSSKGGLLTTSYRPNPYTGKTNYWGYMKGTSMAAPCVAGIIACWLQAHPTWGLDSIRSVMKESAFHDSWTATNPERFGNGKINAMGGIPAPKGMLNLILQDDECPINSDYELADRSLRCVHVSHDRTIIYAQDNGLYAHPQVKGDSQIDYLKEQGHIIPEGDEYDQSNWVKILLPEALDSTAAAAYPGHYLKNVKGKLTSKSYPCLEASCLPEIAEPAELGINKLIPANLYGDQNVDGNDYFFLKPKPFEIDTITLAQWNEEKQQFEAQANTIGERIDGLQGAFKADFSLYGDTVPSLVDGCRYQFLALTNADETVCVYPLGGFVSQGLLPKVSTLQLLVSDSAYIEGGYYGISDDDLTAVFVSKDGKTVYAKDDSRYAQPEEPAEGEIDYIKDKAGLMSPDEPYDQSNWIAIHLPEPIGKSQADSLIGHRLQGLIGKLMAKERPELKADSIPAAGSEGSVKTNMWIPANFEGTQDVDSTRYFFVKPKPLEIDTITLAQWNEGTQQFEVPLRADSTRLDGLKGAFKAQWEMFCDSLPELTNGFQYQFVALTRHEDVVNPQGEVQGTQIVAYPLSGWKDVTPFTPGDVNDDGHIDVSDVTALVDQIIGIHVERFNKKAGDLDGDGTFNVGDVTALVSLIVTADQQKQEQK